MVRVGTGSVCVSRTLKALNPDQLPVGGYVRQSFELVIRDRLGGRLDPSARPSGVARVVPNLLSALYSASRCRKSVALHTPECPPNPATEGWPQWVPHSLRSALVSRRSCRPR